MESQPDETRPTQDSPAPEGPTEVNRAARPARPGSKAGASQVRISERRSSGPLGDSRGLTAAGCLVLLLVAGFIGALLDLFAGHQLWVFFGIAFIGATALCSARCHAEDLAATIVLPPLVYFVIAFVFTVIDPRSGTHSGGSRQFAIDLGGELVFSAPILLIATIVALGLATARGRASAARRRRRQDSQQSDALASR